MRAHPLITHRPVAEEPSGGRGAGQYDRREMPRVPLYPCKRRLDPELIPLKHLQEAPTPYDQRAGDAHGGIVPP